MEKSYKMSNLPVAINKSNIIRTHLIKKIFEISSNVRKITDVPEGSFVYFEEPIKSGSNEIDRFGRGSLYLKNQILPISWPSINGADLMNVFKTLKRNKVYVLKIVGDTTFKSRVKNGVKID